MEIAGLLIHQDTAAGGHRLDVKILVVGYLGDCLGAQVVAPDITGPIAVGDEVDGVAQPSRPVVLAPLPGKLLDTAVGDGENLNRLVLSSSIVSPLLIPLSHPLIDNSLAVGREP